MSMSSEVKGLLTGKIRLSFVASSFICGLIIYNCTPLRYGLSRLAIPGFFTEALNANQIPDPSQISVNLLIVFLAYICLGAPLQIIIPLFTGNRGLNSWITRKLMSLWNKDSANKANVAIAQPTETRTSVNFSEYFTPAMEVNFSRWVRKFRYESHLEFLDIENDMIVGFVVASEFVLFILVPFILVLLLPIPSIPQTCALRLAILNYKLMIDVFGKELFGVWCVGLPLFLLLTFVIFNHMHFRPYVNQTYNVLRCRFLNHSYHSSGICLIKTKNKGKCPLADQPEDPLKNCELRRE